MFSKQKKLIYFFAFLYASLSLFVNVVHKHAPIDAANHELIIHDDLGLCQVCHFNHSLSIVSQVKVDSFLPNFDLLTDFRTVEVQIESLQLFSNRAPPSLG